MPFKELAEKHNKEYIESTDWRVRKPHVCFHEDKPDLKIVISNNWVLESDNLETMLDKPNDVAIYSNIAQTALTKAKAFHAKYIIPRVNSGFGSHTLRQEELKDYYNYFEIIITAVVFAYNSIETFANICIPDTYTLSIIDNSGNEVIFNKSLIERQFTLRDKLKKILPEVLSCESPTQQKWWEPFTKLESLRNEIVHSKDSKSEDRYSKLLSSRIFKIVQIHKEVIEFFGKCIHDSDNSLLDEYPNGFGYDTYKVKKMKDANFKKSMDVLKGG
jgi:hypothetical protein